MFYRSQRRRGRRGCELALLRVRVQVAQLHARHVGDLAHKVLDLHRLDLGDRRRARLAEALADETEESFPCIFKETFRFDATTLNGDNFGPLEFEGNDTTSTIHQRVVVSMRIGELRMARDGKFYSEAEFQEWYEDRWNSFSM